MGRRLRRWICQVRSTSLQHLPTTGLQRICCSADGVPCGSRVRLRLHRFRRRWRTPSAYDDPATGDGSDDAGRSGARHDVPCCHPIRAANHLPDAISLFHTAIHNGVYHANILGRRLSRSHLQRCTGSCLFSAHASVSSQHRVASPFGRIHGRSRIPNSVVDGSHHSEFTLRHDAGPSCHIRRHTACRSHVSGIDSLEPLA